MNKDIIVLIAVGAAVVSALAATLGSSIALLRYLESKKTKPAKNPTNKKIPKTPMDRAKKQRDIQYRLYRQNLWTIRLLITSQIIISTALMVIGILATFFNQNPPSGPVTGLLGVIVLSSILIQMQRRPDARLQGASQRLAKLKSTIRDAGKKLNALNKGRQGFLDKDKINKNIEETLEDVRSLAQDEELAMNLKPKYFLTDDAF